MEGEDIYAEMNRRDGLGDDHGAAEEARILQVPLGGGRFLMSEVPLYRPCHCWEVTTPRRARFSSVKAYNLELSSLIFQYEVLCQPGQDEPASG